MRRPGGRLTVKGMHLGREALEGVVVVCAEGVPRQHQARTLLLPRLLLLVHLPCQIRLDPLPPGIVLGLSHC